MSNIYIQEPPTYGKVLLKTTVGDIEIELWSKEAPQACRNFIQLCMEKYYNNTIFHRVVKEFIVQGGDPTGTGEGGESIYGRPFKDEFHTRLRFCRRGLVAMANAGKDDNGSQFFFTLGPTQELQNKHTIFGKVAGDTIYNMLKLNEGLVDEDERPVYPQKITGAEILSNPFDDIIPRSISKPKDGKEGKKKEKTAAVKNFKLLSFGEEAEEDEEQTIAVNKEFVGKGKSAHDTLSDPKLSSQSAIEAMTSSNDSDEESEERLEMEKVEMTNRIKNKLLSKKMKEQKHEQKEDEEEDEDDFYIGKTRDEENKKKLGEIKKDIKALKKEIQNEKKTKEIMKIEVEKEEIRLSEERKEYIESQAKYKEAKNKLPTKSDKDNFAAKMLEAFKNKLHSTKDKIVEEKEEENSDDLDGDEWMTHSLQSDEQTPVLAKDASTKDDDWFEIYDPRNPINKRRRGETTDKSKKIKK